MRNVSFAFDELSAVPIPPGGGDDSWRVDAVARLVALHGLDVAQAERLGSGLAAASADAAGAVGQEIALFSADTSSFSVMRITVLEREIAPDEREAFLWPPSTLPPRIWLTPRTPSGVGCSSTVLEDPASGLASVRWLFMPTGASVLVTLAPVAARSVLILGAIAETILESLAVDGLGSESAADFDPAALVERVDVDGRTWKR